MISNFFIERPRFAWVVAIFIVLAGVLSFRSLPVAQYPDVAPPTITMTVAYPGASAETVSQNVVSVIEEELNGLRNLLYFSSQSNNSGAEIQVTFQPGTDPALAQVDVQNRLKQVEADLPPDVTRQGISVEQANAGFLLMYALSFKAGHAVDIDSLSDYAARNINNELRRIEGVGKVQAFSEQRAMRIWVDPDRLTAFGLSMDDVTRAIGNQNRQLSTGMIGATPSVAGQGFNTAIHVEGMLTDPRTFEHIVVRANQDGSSIRLSDVAEVKSGSQSYQYKGRLNGEPTALAAVLLQPGANALATATLIEDRLAALSAQFPDEMTYSIPYDTTRFVEVAITKVFVTLLEAIALVFLVMWLFLQNLRYTIIPIVVVPISLIGTLAVIYAAGFSINMMTLFGMVLAIGILVDDAIIVVENVERIMALERLSPKQATIKAMQQISGAIVSITAVLVAVFLPLAFMSGVVGVIYRQFSISLAVSILFSGFLALTLTPALCVSLLKPVAYDHSPSTRGLFGWFNRRVAAMNTLYAARTGSLIERTGRYMAIYLALVLALGWTYNRLPSGFLPEEDMGYGVVDVQLAPGASMARTEQTMSILEAHYAERPAIESVISVVGYSFAGMGENAGLVFPTFRDWSLRGADESVRAETDRVNDALSSVEDGTIFAVAPPAISGVGEASGFEFRLQDRGAVGREALIDARDRLIEAARASPVIAYVRVEGLQDSPRLRLDIDREQAEAMGVGFDAIGSVLSTAFGSAYVNRYANLGRMQRVIVQAAPGRRMTPEDLSAIHVPARDGRLVPISAISTQRWEMGPAQMARYNGYNAFRLNGDAAPGYSSGDAMAEMERLASALPRGVAYEWTGLSLQEKLAGQQAMFLLGLSILVVFLLLVALYESWIIPLSVMLIVPIGAFGAVLMVTVFGMTNDVYFKIGLVTIIGLAAKNAILIVEFAKALQDQGRSLKDATLEAASMRLRPLVMTSFAFILGVVPLAIASGAGAASQRAIGIGVIGGMLGATLLGIFFVPVFYVWIRRLFDRPGDPVVVRPSI